MVRYCMIIMFSIVILSGCVSMDTRMASWVGDSIDDLTASWGAPDSRINRNDGGATYTWETLNSNKYGVQQCRQTFVTNPAGKIVSWSYNGCPSFVPK